jgi:hypothetical protein
MPPQRVAVIGSRTVETLMNLRVWPYRTTLQSITGIESRSLQLAILQEHQW